MPNLLTYIEETQYDNFYDKPINKLDILALTELSYLLLIIWSPTLLQKMVYDLIGWQRPLKRPTKIISLPFLW